MHTDVIAVMLTSTMESTMVDASFSCATKMLILLKTGSTIKLNRLKYLEPATGYSINILSLAEHLSCDQVAILQLLTGEDQETAYPPPGLCHLLAPWQ